ncbi:uncharacterized protein LTR77_010146 [Saxophila tyrrhenica]|uniref:BTB domain-containing protein n=1 Tax=Saxophila tyrrhenica TaxID=1690608 RepID=A0AAV9NYM6_9PEZI|nr:hypothetical protein LTR77_010146 [Saxophila tyrrhenica]
MAVKAEEKTPGSDRSAKRTKFDYFEDVVVLVGKEEARFVVHKAIVCRTSDFFRAACHGEWKEASEKTVRFPEVEANIFGIYMGFLYTGNIDMRLGHAADCSTDAKPLKDLSTEHHHQILDWAILAYALGEMLQDCNFRNAVVDAIKKLLGDFGHIGGVENVTSACQRASRSSKLMKLFVDTWASAGYGGKPFKDWAKEMPIDFVFDMACASVDEAAMSKQERSPYAREKCYYHDHKDGEKCK